MFDIKILALSVAAALVFGSAAGWTVNGWRLNGKIDRLQAEHSLALAKATEAARLESERMQKVKDEAIDEANRIAQKNAADAASARTELGRVRQQLASRSALNNATCASTRDYADTLTNIFSQCAARLGEVAQSADGHAADSRTCQAAWPRSR